MKYIFAILLLALGSCSIQAAENAPALPEKPERWLDGKSMQWKDLEGKVVLLNVWTFGCWNSYRSLPWVVGLEKKFPDLQVIGVHSPEFSYEKDRNRMRQVMAEYGVSYPQILDDGMDYWRELSNHYWPSFYVVDQGGRIRGAFFGETHEGDRQAKQVEDLIRKLQQGS